MSIANKDGSARGAVNDSGTVVLPLANAQRIEVVFEWCREKKSSFDVHNMAANAFTLELQPSISDVVFDHVRMRVDNGQITGMLSFMGGDLYPFVKSQ